MKKLNMLPMALSIIGLGAASSFADIKLNDNLTTAGFLDMSVNGYTPDSGKSALNASFDQFRINFMYKFANISARADISAMPSSNLPGSPAGSTSTVFLKQGLVNYAMGNAGLTVGRFLSASGFEAVDPTGMFQYSYSKTLVYGYYQNGLALNYTAPKFALYGSVVSDLWNPQEFDLKTPGFEGQVSVMPVEGVTAKVAYLYQVSDEALVGYDGMSLINAWAQYAKGPLTVAAEYNYMMNWKAKDETGNGWLAMANYKFTDKIATTVRYSGIKMKSAKDPDTEVTLSPSYAVSPNWLVLAELKQEIELKRTNYAVESTFSY